MTNDEFRALAEKATPGPWEADTTKSDGDYGSGPDCRSGYMTSQLVDANGSVIADALNSDIGCVHEEFDDDGVYAWDDVAKKNFAYIAAACNEVPRLLDEIEALRARVKALEGALGPFAEQAGTFDSPGGKEFVPDKFTPAFVTHTIGDLRRARAALEGK